MQRYFNVFDHLFMDNATIKTITSILKTGRRTYHYTNSLSFLFSNQNIGSYVSWFIRFQIKLLIYIYIYKHELEQEGFHTIWSSIFTLSFILLSVRCKSFCKTTLFNITSYFYDLLIWCKEHVWGSHRNMPSKISISETRWHWSRRHQVI